MATKNVVRSLMWAAEKQLITVRRAPFDSPRRDGLTSVLSRAQTDFILAPCDLLLSPANLHAPSISLAALLDRHRSDDNLLTTLFSERAAGNLVEARKNGACFSLALLCALNLTRRTRVGPPEVLTIYDHKTSTLLDIREMDDFDEDEVPLRTSLLAK